MESKKENMPLMYMPQIDALRTFAVLLVMFQHWIPHEHWINTFNNGLMGVLLFFVLSGFLITQILLKMKTNIIEGESLLYSLKQFYIRRSIRIFPIYFLLVILLFSLNFQSIRTQIIYFITYTQNFLFALQDQNFGYLIHFWSLGVEEQFYLFWPLLILISPNRFLPFLIGLMIIFGLVTRIIFLKFNLVIGPANFLMPCAIDSFAIGGLAAYFASQDKLRSFLNIKNSALIIISNFLIFHFTPLFDFYIFFSIICIIIISHASFGVTNIFRYILNNRIILFLGKISYGIYLFHYLIYPLNNWLHEFCIDKNIKIPLLNIIPFPEFDNIFIRFVYFSIFTIILASISWYFIEKPFNNLKGKFGYKKA